MLHPSHHQLDTFLLTHLLSCEENADPWKQSPSFIPENIDWISLQPKFGGEIKTSFG
jgi:hypothetical protein